MCTAATYKTADFYMGRTLDYERSFGDRIAVTPRNYPFRFHRLGTFSSHYAMLGMAAGVDSYPLYYEAFNEKGLGVCGLSFKYSTVYFPEQDGKDNLAQYELIPWLLGQCASVKEARVLLERMNLVDIPFQPGMSAARLHWLIADAEDCITVESVADGLRVYDNPAGVMTNEPPFPLQLFNLNNYRHLGNALPENTFGIPLDAYSRGMGGLGLPGDLSSQSRFVRAAFTRLQSLSGSTEEESVSQFFHILESVNQTRGLCRLDEGYEITIYTCCCNATRGIYYYTTYGNHQISAVDLHRENLEGSALVFYPLVTTQQIRFQN